MQTIAYDEHADTVMDLYGPEAARTGATVVLLHGGFWREPYRRDLMVPLVPSLTGRGHTVVNLEYRRVGGAGGWPTTLVDVAAGIDRLANVPGLDTSQVVTVGHSAGGHLAVWAAARHRLPAGAPGGDPVVRPVHAVSQAGVVVLDDAVAADLGQGAVAELLGGAAEDRLAAADPARLLPLGVGVTLVHGSGDATVPLAQSERWCELSAAAGDVATLHACAGDHMDVIDPAHETWDVVLAAIRAIVEGGGR